MKKRIMSLLMGLAIVLSALSGFTVSGSSESNAIATEDFIVKENMELYTSDEGLSGYWKYSNSSMISLTLEEENTLRVYRENGKSLKCSYNLSDGNDYFGFYYNNKIFNEDLNGNNLGYNSRLGFWIYTDSNISLSLKTLDSKTSGTEIQTDSVTLSSGEHFVYFDWTDFNNWDVGIFEYIYDLKFVVTPESSAGNIWVDQIGIEVLGEGKNIHGDGFYETVAGDNWANKTADTATLYYGNDEFCYSGTTNVDNDGTSLKIDYTNITSTTKSNFYYNSDLRIKHNALTEGTVSDNLYGEDTVLALWVRADKPVVLELSYEDRNLSNERIQSSKYSTTLKSGENILKVPLKDLVGSKNSAYHWVYQLQFWLSSLDTTAVSGSIYIDAIGFYNTNTDNELSDKILSVGEIKPENIADVWDIVYYYNGLSENEKQNITSNTMYSYNKLVSNLRELVPQVVFADTLESSEDYSDGTLAFDIEINNTFRSGYTVLELGAVVHRKALVEKTYTLSKETENCADASQPVKSQSSYYRKNIILKCFDGAAEEDYTGYLRTEYLLRPYITYKNADGSILTVYGDVYDTSSKQITAEDENVNKAIDNSLDTAWEVSSAGNYTLYLDFDAPKTFNSVDFSEKSQGEHTYTDANGNLVATNTQIYGITNFSLSVSDDKKTWKQIYNQDEMGCRTIVLDDTYTASFVKIDVTTDMTAGISEATFKTTEKFDKNLRVVSYVRMSEDITEYSENIKALTDIILIDYGDWNQKGEFVFTENNGDGGEASKAALTDRVAKIKQLNPDINVWFSLRRVALAEDELKTDVFSETTDKQALIDTCVGLCDEFGFAGIDFDFEYPEGATQLSNYNEFLISLGSELHNNGYMLSIATSDFVNHTQSASYIDYVNLMAYDRITFDRFGRHNTANAIYRQINRIMEYGFSKDQINLGLGFYGKTLGGKDSVTYKGLVRQYYDTAVNGGNTYASNYYCSGPSLVADKVVLALQQDLCGVFSWSLTTDLPLQHELSLAGSVDRTIERFTVAN